MDGRKETVLKAVSRSGPGRIPLLYAYSFEKSDVVNIPVIDHFMGEKKNLSEWGFEWEHLENGLLMGQPKRPVIGEWPLLKDFVPPDPARADRFSTVCNTMAKLGPDRYYKANFVLSGFTILSMLRGFESIMEDFYFERDNLEKLCDIVFSFEDEVIKLAAGYGFSAIGLADDWGGQSSLLISPALWREIFKPRYKSQIDLAHSLGLQVYMHSCGYIFDIIGDLIEIGLDIINPGQPDINGIPEMGDGFGGRICFACSVSYQTTGVSGGNGDIEAQVSDYVKYFGSHNGGLIGIIPEDSEALGISKEKLGIMERAFQSYVLNKSGG
jgi:hypothetical protein